MLSKFQIEVAHIVLSATEPYGFALGGGAALIAHGIINRLTKDIDSYTPEFDEEVFIKAREAVVDQLSHAGFSTKISKLMTWFVAIDVFDKNSGDILTIDLGQDYRSKNPILIADLGPVLDVHDVIAGKVRAFWDRGTARDYIDIEAILRSGTTTVYELFKVLPEFFPDITIEEFYEALINSKRHYSDYLSYGLSKDDITILAEHLKEYADELLGRKTK